jgi:hypothetical protein
MESLAADGLITTYWQNGEQRMTLLDVKWFGAAFGRRVVTQKGNP